jgi:4-amino-4-deoxy-L-arabinose transferase-like glycosyltransferase
MRGNKTNNFVIQWWQSFEKYPAIAWGFSFILLAWISWLAFLGHLGSVGLIDETEPLFAEAARQMVVTGDWITPYFNGETRFDKPPLIYWLMAIGYKLIGVNEWAVRLPSALAAIALTVFCFFTIRYFGFATPAAAKNPFIQSNTLRQLWISAWIGGAIAALNLQTLSWARQGVSDMLLSACMGMALFSFFWGYGGEGRGQRADGRRRGKGRVERGTRGRGKYFCLFPSNRWYLAFYIFAALAVLTKGPVGIVIPGLIIISFLLYIGKLKEVLSEMGVIVGGLIFLAICLPWYILVTLQNGDAFINSFFGYHNFERFTNVVNNHSAPWYFYFLIVLGLFAPWSIYLPLSITRLRFWQRSFWSQQPRQAHLSLFAFFWFIDIFLFFTVSVTKLPSYVLPLIPAAAILVALFWGEQFAQNSHKTNYGFLISAVINTILLLLLAGASLLIPQLIGSDALMVNLAQLIKRSQLPLIGGTIWAIAAIICIFLLRKKEQWRWIIAVNAIAFMAFILFFFSPAYLLVDKTRQLPLRQIAEIVTQVKQPQESIMMIGFKKPSVAFYTQDKIGFFWTFDQPATSFLENLATASSNSSTVLIIGQPQEIDETGLQPQDYKILTQKSPYQLIRVTLQKALEKALGS